MSHCRHCDAAWTDGIEGWPLSRHEDVCALAITCPHCEASAGERCVYPGGQTKQEPHSARQKLAREFPVSSLEEVDARGSI